MQGDRIEIFFRFHDLISLLGKLRPVDESETKQVGATTNNVRVAYKHIDAYRQCLDGWHRRDRCSDKNNKTSNCLPAEVGLRRYHSKIASSSIQSEALTFKALTRDALPIRRTNAEGINWFRIETWTQNTLKPNAFDQNKWKSE